MRLPARALGKLICTSISGGDKHQEATRRLKKQTSHGIFSRRPLTRYLMSSEFLVYLAETEVAAAGVCDVNMVLGQGFSLGPFSHFCFF